MHLQVKRGRLQAKREHIPPTLYTCRQFLPLSFKRLKMVSMMSGKSLLCGEREAFSRGGGRRDQAAGKAGRRETREINLLVVGGVRDLSHLPAVTIALTNRIRTSGARRESERASV